MTTVEAVGANVAARPVNAAQKPVIDSDFETFLKMLTTQMKNQDPLNPMDSSDFAVQLATFSSVEQQVLTNDLLKGLSTQMGQAGMAQLAPWVGMDARAPMPARFDGFPVTLQVRPEPTADSAILVVRNDRGEVVDSRPLSLTDDSAEWSGRDGAGQSLPSGLYQFEVESYLQDTLQQTSIPEVYGRVIEARIENGATVLLMEGGAVIAADKVTAVR
ncbi:MAG: flagellar hook capping FlgD N-terminal domain-containing protein [Paracoccaceae bacterium]|uniref:flagellar hook capping FlgD N-terminal domain-containing protein n=1 Tax=Seohaeicola saemankumensis TaxID=481181 RepID=UPI001E392F0F|nr:flagellar hook capping FlgD N-terminal domain-containing protein [Seohaeicola saemankumensis]MCD1625055.1 flagellar hook assembly protein FlgD [Seohaeicola saemankumensis]